MNKIVLAVSLVIALWSPSHAGDDHDASALRYLDSLKTCTPYSFSYPHPFVRGFTGQNIIKGKMADNCLVTFIMPGDKKLECAFTPDTIKLLTSEAKYQEAREHKMSGSTSDSISKKMTEECKL
jgi:hypothetical protein